MSERGKKAIPGMGRAAKERGRWFGVLRRETSGG